MTTHPDLDRLVAAVAADPAGVAAASADGTLADWLYRNWYMSLGAAPASAADLPLATLDAGLCDIVDAAAPWQDGWVVLGVDALGNCLVGRGEERRQATPGRYAAPDRPGLPPMPGDRLTLPRHLSWRDAETGQWAAQSAVPPEGPLVRIYANAGPDAVGDAVAGLVARLTEADVPFRLKCPGDGANFARADALVLYLAAVDWSGFRPALLDWAAEIAPRLRDGRPALTRPLARGIGLAEDPGDGRSFGQQRCALLAEALAEPIDQTLPARLEHALAAAGIPAHEPWRNAR